MRLERFGRVFVKNQLLAELGVDTVNRDLDLRELYNQEDPFQLAPDYLGAYRARLNANLAGPGRHRREDRLAPAAGRDPPADRAVPRRLPSRGRRQAVLRGQLSRDRAGAAAGPPAHDLRWPVAQRRCGRHEPHVRHHGREWSAHQRRCRPGDGAGVGQVSLPGPAESRRGRRGPGPGSLQARGATRLSRSSVRRRDPREQPEAPGSNPPGSDGRRSFDGRQRTCDDGGGHRRREPRGADRGSSPTSGGGTAHRRRTGRAGRADRLARPRAGQHRGRRAGGGIGGRARRTGADGRPVLRGARQDEGLLPPVRVGADRPRHRGRLGRRPRRPRCGARSDLSGDRTLRRGARDPSTGR